MEKLTNCWKKLKSILHPKNVYGSQYPLVNSLNCSGLVPYRVVEQNILKRCKWCYFIASTNIIIFTYAFALTVKANTSFIECFFRNDLSKVGNNLHFVVSFLSMFTIYISCFYQRKKMKNVFDRLFQIDLKLKNLLTELSHRRGLRFNFIVLIVTWTVYYTFIVGSISMIVTTKKKFVVHSWVSYFLPNFMVNFIIMMFVCVMKQIKTRYEGCNQVCDKNYKSF